MRKVPEPGPNEEVQEKPIQVSPAAIATIVRTIKLVVAQLMFYALLIPICEGWKRVCGATILVIFYDAIIRIKK